MGCCYYFAEATASFKIHSIHRGEARMASNQMERWAGYTTYPKISFKFQSFILQETDVYKYAYYLKQIIIFK